MNKTNKILFLRPGKLGDMIVATPLFGAIKRSNPDTYIAVACSPYNEIIIRHNPNLNCIRVVNYHSIIQVLQLIFWIRKQQFDWVIDLTPGISKTSSLVSRFVRSPLIRTAGMHKGDHSRYFDKVTDYKDMHLIDRNRLLIENVFECSFCGEFNPDITILQEHKETADALLSSIKNSPIRIGINCSAGDKCRQWNEDKYLKVVELINEKYPEAAVVLFSFGIQDEWVLRIKDQTKNSISVNGVDILIVAAAIKQMSFFFTPDTSLLHIASGFKIPTVGLYCIGGENYIRWRAYNTQKKDLVAENSVDVNEISPLQAFNAIVELIESVGI